ncbi:MAG: penicillin-binding transpeptidase domain-containing protein [Chromatiales bacterium]|nr:penicillin-binding transpeptidase domain-containing protein [Chromatiales bacterium]
MAILVVAHRDRRVLAYVGASDFHDPRRAGQVDMVRAMRSPGSTLKPLVYGLGFDDLLIHPETLIEDVPTRFGDYSPTNFRNTYAGQLTVREALQQSLNIPAVAVLEQVGPARSGARGCARPACRCTGARRIRSRDLPLVLGGVGMTLEELVTLYAGFANGGRVDAVASRPRRSRDDRVSRLLTETACWYLGEILRSRPDSARTWRTPGQRRPAAPDRPQDRHLLRFPRRLGAGLRRRLHRRACGSGGRTVRPVPVITAATPLRRCCSGYSTCCRNPRPDPPRRLPAMPPGRQPRPVAGAAALLPHPAGGGNG